MYFKDVEAYEPPEEASRFGRAIRGAKTSGAPVPGIYHLFAFRPKAAGALGEFTQQVMSELKALTPGQAELIAAFTSARNDCGF